MKNEKTDIRPLGDILEMAMFAILSGIGVTAYALMAAGGDLGASISPQLMGIVIDRVSATDFAAELGMALNLSAEQIGLKAGMLVTAIFPVIGTILLVFTSRYFKRQKTKA